MAASSDSPVDAPAAPAPSLSSSSVASSSVWRGGPAPGPLAAGTVALLLFGWAYWPTVTGLVAAWLSNPDYSHGFAVLPVSVWLLWVRRDRYPRNKIAPAWGGLLLIALAGVARCVSARLYLPEVDGWSIPLWCCGVVWLLGGRPVLKWAAPAIVFLYFMIPLPATLELFLSRPLQLMATQASTWTLQSLGQPALAEGTTVLLGEHVLEVERACSGLRMFYGVFALAVAFLMLRRPHWLTSLILLSGAAPIAMLANTIRVTATGLLFRFVSDEAARHFSHDFAGLLTIPVAVGMFGIVLFLVERLAGEMSWSRSRAMLSLARFLILLAVVIPSAVFWHAFQQSRNETVLLSRASTLEREQDWARAADYLDRYLRLQPDDLDVRIRLAHAVDRAARTPAVQERALLLFAETYQNAPDRPELGLRHAQLALELGRFGVAIEACNRLQTNHADDLHDGNRVAAQTARIKALALLGRFSERQSPQIDEQWQLVVKSLEEAIRINNADLELWVQLAELLRRRAAEVPEEQSPISADSVIDNMVTANSDNADAWLARYRYRLRHHASPVAAQPLDESIHADLDRAIALNRSDPQNRSKPPFRQSLDVLLAAGDRAAQRNESDQSRSFYEQALSLAPADFRAYLLLGELEIAAGTTEAREQAVVTWMRGLRNVGHVEVALVLPLTEALIDLGRLNEAEEQMRPLERSVQWMPEPVRSTVALGLKRLRAKSLAVTGSIRDAATLLRTALRNQSTAAAVEQVRPQFAAAWGQLGDYYLLMQLPDQAVVAFERARTLEPKSHEWTWKAARACRQVGRLDEALQLYAQVVQADGSGADAALELAQVSFLRQLRLPRHRRDWHAFQQTLSLAEERKADRARLAQLNVDFAIADGRPQDGLDILKRALAELPDSALLWQAMANVQQSLGTLAEAKLALLEFERCVDSPFKAAMLRGAILARAGELEEAKAALISARPAVDGAEQFQIRYQLALIDLQSGQRGEARRQLDRLAGHPASSFSLVAELARLAWEDRDWAAVERHERQFQELEGPGGTLWRDYRARRLLSQATEIGDVRFQEAIRLQREIVRLRPLWPRGYVLQGQIARRQGRGREAVDAFSQAARLGDRSIALAEELIDLLLSQRRFSEADRSLTRVQDYVAQSSRLSTAAIPLYVRRGEAEQAIELARDWIRRQPDDPLNHMRLGRTLLLTSFEGSPQIESSLAEAEQAFRRAVELGPADIRNWVALFRYYVRYRQNESAALATLQQLAERLDIPAEVKAFVLAQLYESVGRRSRAATHYRRAIELATDQSRISILVRAARFFAAAENLDLAERYARQAAGTADSTAGTADSTAGTADSTAGTVASTAGTAASANGVPPAADRVSDLRSARLTLVGILTAQGEPQQLDEAEELLKTLLEPNDPRAGVRRALVAILIARNDEPSRRRARQMLEVLVRNPSRSDPIDRILLSTLYEAEGRILPAYEQLWPVAGRDDVPPARLVTFIEFLHRHVDKNPQFAPKALLALEQLESRPETDLFALRLRLQRVGQDERDRTEQIGAIQNVVDAVVNRRLLAEDRDVDKKGFALKLFVLLAQDGVAEEMLRLCRQTPPLLPSPQLAVCLATAGAAVPQSDEFWQTGEPILASALADHPDDVELLFASGNLRYVQRNPSEAIELYRRVLMLDPGHTTAMNNLALSLAETPADLGEAYETIQRTIEAAGRQPRLLDTQAVILLRRGQPRAALKLLKEVLDGGEIQAVSLLHLAFAHHELGEMESARRAFQRAVRLNVSAALVTHVDRKMLTELQQHFEFDETAGGRAGG